MVFIQIIGKTPHPTLFQLFRRFLSALAPTLCWEGGSPLDTRFEKYSYCIANCQQPQYFNIDAESTVFVLLFQDSCRLPPNVFQGWESDNVIAIVNAENTPVLRELSASGIRAVPCGLSSHDTVTLASATEESLVVSLQRSLAAFSGETVEPMEFPIHGSPASLLSRYLLMAFCAVCCLTGYTAELTAFLTS